MGTTAAIVVNWNGGRLLGDTLRSLAAQDTPAARTVVVDNGSTDGSWEETRAEFPGILLLRNRENRGFAEANNQGIAHALADPAVDAVFLFNNDMRAEPGALSALAAALTADPRRGSVQAKILFADPQDVINSAGDFVDADDLRVVNRGYGERDQGQYDEPVEIFSPCAGAALYRREFLEDVALAPGVFFDPTYFAYLEDVDLACRGHLRGWHFWVEPRAVAHHHESATSRRLPAATKEYLSRRNRLWTAVKTYPRGVLGEALVRYALPSARGVRFATSDPRAPALGANARASLRAFAATVPALPRLLRRRREIRARATDVAAFRAWFRPPRAIHRP